MGKSNLPLTLEKLQAVPEGFLPYMLWEEYLLWELDESRKARKDEELLPLLPLGFRMVIVYTRYDGALLNGGYHFFYHYFEARLNEILSVLEKIGADDAVRRFRRAMELYPKSLEEDEARLSEEYNWEEMERGEKEGVIFDELDREYNETDA